MLAGSVSFGYLLLLNYIKKASNNDSTLREIFGGPSRTWTYDQTIMSPCTVFYTGFHQVILTNIKSILTLLFTNTKCYWLVLNIMADRYLYGHLNPRPWFLSIICWLDCGDRCRMLRIIGVTHRRWCDRDAWNTAFKSYNFNHFYLSIPVLHEVPFLWQWEETLF